MRDAGGEVRVLVAQFLQASDQSLSNMSQEAGLVALILMGVGNSLALITAPGNYTNPVGLAVWAGIAVGGVMLYVEELANGNDVAKALRKATEQTDPDFFDKLVTLNQAQLHDRSFGASGGARG